MADYNGKRPNDGSGGDGAGKKQRLETPSAVLHCRNVPPEATEMELMLLGQPFGRVVNVLVLRNTKGTGKTQAFIEMESADIATQMLLFYSSAPPMVRARSIYFNFSSHQHLTTPPGSNRGTGATGPNMSMGAPNMGMGAPNMGMTGPNMGMTGSNMGMGAPNMGMGMSGPNMGMGGMGAPNMGMTGPNMGMGAPNMGMGMSGPNMGMGGMGAPNMGMGAPNMGMGAPNTGMPGSVILVRILNQVYPVTLDVLHTVFSKIGQVQKLVSFTKSDGVFQCLVQYSDPATANQAKTMLDGQNLYSGCCTLKIESSKLPQLTVKFNNDKTWDYTNPNLPSGDNQPSTGGYGQMAMPPQMPTNNMGGAPAMPPGMTGPQGPYGNMSGMMQPGSMQPPNMAGNMGMNPTMQGISTMPGNMRGPMGGAPMTGAQGQATAPTPQGGSSCVILINRLEPAHMTPDRIFMLVGVYADVLRVKILFNKKDSALVQVADAQQAQTAIKNLNGLVLYGKDLHLTLSKYNEVVIKGTSSDDLGKDLSKEYTGSPLHRFRNPSSRNFQHIVPPGQVLHLSGLPASMGEQEIKGLFSEFGTVTGFRFLQSKDQGTSDRRMALIQFSAVEEAVIALMNRHNYQFGERAYLRISFSKATF